METKIDENQINKIIENFNKDFETKIKLENTKFLINLFDNFISLSSTSLSDKKYLNKLVELEDLINEIFTKEQKEIFDQWNNTQDKFFLEIEQQAFLYGYCACKQLDIESNKSRD